MTHYERFSHVSKKVQAEEIRNNLRAIGFKTYYKFEWVVYREVLE